MKLIGRVTGALAFLYDLVWNLAAVAIGIAMIGFGIAEEKIGLVGLGALVILVAGGLIAWDVWPSGREDPADRYGPP
jgi:hypothetical protein